LVEFTGERVIPGQVNADLLNEHLARYVFAARLARGKRVLDAGCGTGYGSAELVRSALSVVGADISTDAVAFAREHYRLPSLSFEQASCTALPHPDGTFDLVVAFEVIEHLARWFEFLREVRRVLAPAGQLIVSTPNKLYYAESRRLVGANPFHEHEFEFGEFQSELETVFPYVSLFLENHVAGVVFRPVQDGDTAEVRADGGDAVPAEAHFFVAVCAHRPQTGNPTFVYVPSSANVLRERETHIELLEGWLEKAKADLAALAEAHRRQTGELEESNQWAARLNRELEASGTRIQELQRELFEDRAKARAKIDELEGEGQRKTEWALRLEAELHERTRWAQSLDAANEQLRARLGTFESSRWVRLGRQVGLGPGSKP
jgi:SAM-dependent methyltransferase